MTTKSNIKQSGIDKKFDSELAELTDDLRKLLLQSQKTEEICQEFENICDKIKSLTKIKEAQEDEATFTNDDIQRYSRQLLLPGFGVVGQMKLKKSSIIIAGVGGLGCPAAQYLVAAGCKKLGLIDYDVVERNNLHRQTLHTEGRIGMRKTESAKVALNEINPNCNVTTYSVLLNHNNALEILGDYDIVLDCTDNVATRYLLNDACVLLHKPLVSGSALQFDGQLTVYNYGEKSPCYRCIFPLPPPPETVTNCSDGGVLGAVTGTIGSLQALEAVKIASGFGDVLAGRLLIFDGIRCVFRNIKLRSRRADCNVCSDKPLITRLINYEYFCNMPASDKDFALKILPNEERISVEEYEKHKSMPHILIDVRPSMEFEICHLPTAINVPMEKLLDNRYQEKLNTHLGSGAFPVYVFCRRGNDSQIAVHHLREKYPTFDIHDVIGGLHAWHKNIDKDFPIY